jgi:hypothetical protein
VKIRGAFDISGIEASGSVSKEEVNVTFVIQGSATAD